MQSVWRKTRVPHRVRQGKTMQIQKANGYLGGLVAAAKNFSPHKERNNKT
jgi:hypothetical protein